jgi:phage-related protein (TIGR01555 family)
MWMYDRLVNLVSGLGTSKDKAAGSSFLLALLDRTQLDAAYRGDWIARKIIDVPPFDETREWRDWQAEKPQIEALEKEEARVGLPFKVARARKRARLYGGSVLYMGVDQGQPEQPLNIEAVRKGALKYVHALSRHEITAGEIDRDPQSEFYGEPLEYTLSTRGGEVVKIHPSRVVRFIGAEIPDENLAPDGWGDSALQAVNDAVQHAGLAAGGIASLLTEAKVDIIRVPDFMASLGAKDYRDRIIERFSLANTAKSMVNAVLLDKEEEWAQKQVSFAQMPEILNTYLQIASGAADIPATRLLGQTPGGLQSTGESDVRNYYDRVSADQKLTLGPALSRLDEVLIRSALGNRPPDVHYIWAPLWQVSETEKADIADKKAKAIKSIHDTGLVPDAAFARGVQNMLVEDGTYPGLDTALEEFGDEPIDRAAEAEAERLNAEAAARASEP